MTIKVTEVKGYYSTLNFNRKLYVSLIVWSDSDTIIILFLFSKKSHVAETCFRPEFDKITYIKLKCMYLASINFVQLINSKHVEYTKQLFILFHGGFKALCHKTNCCTCWYMEKIYIYTGIIARISCYFIANFLLLNFI